MIKDGFVVSPTLTPMSAATGSNGVPIPLAPSCSSSSLTPRPAPHALALKKTISNPTSEATETTADSADMSRSGSSSTRITSPEAPSRGRGRGLRHTASAPPRSGQASLLAPHVHLTKDASDDGDGGGGGDGQREEQEQRDVNNQEGAAKGKEGEEEPLIELLK